MAKQQFAMPTKSQTVPPIDPAKFDAFVGGAKDAQVQIQQPAPTSEAVQIKTFPYKSDLAFHERMVKAARYEGLSLKDFVDRTLRREVERIEKSRA